MENMEKRMDDLRHQISELEEQNRSLKECNKLILNGNTYILSALNAIDMPSDNLTSTDVHSFYQDVFITDLQNEIMKKENETVDFKRQMIENSNLVSKLEKENQKVKRMLEFYRDMVSKLKNSSTNSLTNDHGDRSHDYSMNVIGSEADSEHTKKLGTLTQHDHILRSATHLYNSSTLLQKIDKLWMKLQKWDKINDLFDKAHDIIKDLIKWERVTFLVFDLMLVEIFNNEDRGFLYNILIDQQMFYIARYNQKHHKKDKNKERVPDIDQRDLHNALFEPWFSKLDQAYYGIIEKTKMWQSSINTQNKIELVVQCDKYLFHEKHGIQFTANEHLILKVVWNVISFVFKKIFLTIVKTRISERSVNILKTFRDVTKETNIACIFEGVVNTLPNIFRAKKAGFFLIDHSDPKFMYTLTSIGEDENGIKVNLRFLTFIFVVYKIHCEIPHKYWIHWWITQANAANHL